MGIVFLAAWYMLHHTRLGRYIYALGGNEAATRLSGINVNKIKSSSILFVVCWHRWPGSLSGASLLRTTHGWDWL